MLAELGTGIFQVSGGSSGGVFGPLALAKELSIRSGRPAIYNLVSQQINAPPNEWKEHLQLLEESFKAGPSTTFHDPGGNGIDSSPLAFTASDIIAIKRKRASPLMDCLLSRWRTDACQEAPLDVEIRLVYYAARNRAAT